jgi:crotonobetainyl-CoA:carnitine CoA-transferase CaiB-like acyl-CoA transferase
MGERRDEVVSELTELFATKTRAAWMDVLAELDVCVGPVNNFSEAFTDEQVVHRGMVVEGEVPGAGAWRHIGDPIRLREAPGSIDRRPPPKMGEHTDQVLTECGVTSEEVESLRAAGAI